MSAHPATVDSLRTALLAKAEECRRVLLKSSQDIPVETSPGATDRSLRATQRTAAVEKMDSYFRLLKQIETALARLNRGRYGSCLTCQNPVEQKQLNALPWALFCAHCQQRVDLLHKGARAYRKEIKEAA